MQFFEFEGFTVDTEYSEQDLGGRLSYEKARKIRMLTDDFNRKLCFDAYFFVSDISEDTFKIGIISKNAEDVSVLISRYLQAIRTDLKDTRLEEITLDNICELLEGAVRNHYAKNYGKVFEKFDLGDLTNNRYGPDFEYREDIIAEAGKKSVYEKSGKLFVKDTFIPELDRIYSGSVKNKSGGHPVHYMIQTDDTETREQMCLLLLQALHANGRIRNKRCCFIDFKPGERFFVKKYDCLYKSSTGGAVVVNYSALDDSEDGYASHGRATIETICNAMKKYRNRVLTIFCLPRECTRSRDIFYENLGSSSIVELREEFASADRAADFLKILAKANHIRADKKLFAKLEEGRGWLSSDLHSLFDEWYDNKLKTDVYPQYKDIVAVKREVLQAAPKGSAYGELKQMIGLDEAKKVIDRALDYHKAQKLFADKGMKTDHPAMHMVFTGNPGTAKTSVARLFAGIMKENNVLSKGYLIEVGRGNLVGKYVGWTAAIVKKKFEEARGSVLFIDEAYSLIDDRDGSFGDEAINTIVQEMENHRDDVVVIFAGYPDKMETFLQKNPGLRSRIAYYVPFKDYDVRELCEIAGLIARQKGLTLTKGAYEKLSAIFEKARMKKDFGNGRYVRNVIEKSEMALSSRLLAMDYDSIKSADITTICAEDIDLPPEAETTERKSIGFCA